MRVRALLKRVTLLRSRSALSATLPPISGRGRFFGQKNTLRGRPSGRRPPARQKAAHIWRDRDRLHTCRGNRARAPGRKPPHPYRVEARTQIRHAASPGEGARGWGSERASHHMGLGAAASASGAVEPKGGLVSCWGAHRGSCQPWGPALAEHRARAQHAGRSAAAAGGEASGVKRREDSLGIIPLDNGMPSEEAGLHLAERDSHSAICLPSDRICAWGMGLSPSKAAVPGNAVSTPSRGIGVSSQSCTPRKLRPLSPASLGDVGRSFRQSHHGNQLSACSGPATRGIKPALWESLPSGTPLAK